MQKLGIAFIAVASILGGLYFSGILDSDPTTGPATDRGGETATTETGGVDVDFGEDAPATGSSATADPTPSETATTAASADEPGGTGVIAGTVVDVDGRPVEGAIVHLRNTQGRRGWGVPTPPALDDPARRLETDAAGVFHYGDLASGNQYTLYVRGEDWVGQARPLLTPDGASLTITLAPGVAVEGTVLDPNGRAVAGAVVASGGPLQKFGEGMFVPAMGRFDPNTLFPEADTAENGTFRMTGIPVGEFSLTASHDDWAPSEPVNLMQGQVDLALELRVGTGAFGVVRDGAGSPVAGAAVNARSPFQFGPGDGDAFASTTTDRQGRYTLAGLPPQQVSIVAEADGFPQVRRQVSLTAGEETEVDLVLERGAVITGRVIDVDGAPVAGATVTYRSQRQQGFTIDASFGGGGGGSDDVRTDEEGNFRIDGIRAKSRAPRSVHVDHPNYHLWSGEPFEVAAGSETPLGDITLAEAWTVSGTITDLDGAPIAGASVQLLDEAASEPQTERFIRFAGAGGAGDLVMLGGAQSPRVSTDDDGRYTLRVDAAGSYTIRASARGHQKQASAPFAVSEGSVTGIDLSLPPALTIAGVVVDELGVPCAQVSVSAGGPWGGGPTATTDETGAFTIDGLDDKSYALHLAGEGWQLAEGGPTEVAAGATGVELVALRPGQVVGRITDASTGRPVGVFSISSQPVTDGGNAHRISFGGLGSVEYRDPDGRFILDRAPGKHRIVVRAEDYVANEVEVDVLSARETEIAIELTPAGRIAGRVLDTSGDPVEGAHVSAVRLREDGTTEPSGPQSHSFGAISLAVNGGDGDGGMVFMSDVSLGGPSGTTTDAEGRFVLNGLEDGEYQIRVRDAAFKDLDESPVAAASGEVTEVGDLVLERGGRVFGVVTAPYGRKLAWCSVRLTPQVDGESGDRKSGSPDGEGKYSVGGLDPGTYAVKVTYMLEPEADASGGYTFGSNETIDLGTLELGVDEELPLDVELPLPE